ncbi:MAG: SpaH/EbpB family LPXTG-anchored major pilin [Nocardioidaceae bacterium]|nr:SpaH/EbpB family LPXTG-anchored major pilin [Nocardioidaceae bacterium]
MFLTNAGRLRAFLLAIAALGIALVSLASVATAASPSLPDPSRTGSIGIHKFKTPDSATGLPANGTAVDTTGLTPVPGVTFQVQRVDTINLATNEGWQDASALSGSFNPSNASGSIAAAGFTLGTVGTQTTDASGNASFTSLPLGLYLVTETSWPAGATPSAPFLVSVPLTDPANQSAWLYDLHVYPKNSIDAVSKTVDDANAIKMGDPVRWTVVGDIPNVSAIDGYKIVDQLDPKLTYVGAQVTLSDGITFTAGTDYTVVFDAAGHTLTVQFTAAGRAILAAHNTAQVKVVVNTRVNTVGEITNTALLYPNAHSFDVTPGQPGGPTPSNPVITKWGGITVQKTDPSGKALAGAVFSVYATRSDAEARTNAIPLGGRTTFSVNTGGQVTIAGLRYSDWANGAAVAPGDPGYRSYYLAEVQAPTGYELLAEPIKFDVTAATTAVGVDLKIENVRVDGPVDCHCHGSHSDLLPDTGGPALILAVGGGVLLVAGLLVASTSRRRRKAA